MMEKIIEPCHEACESAYQLKRLMNILYEDTAFTSEGDVYVFENSELFDIISKLHIKHKHDHDYRIV